MRHRSLRFRLAAIFALALTIAGVALSGLGYAIVQHTYPALLNAQDLDEAPALSGRPQNGSAPGPGESGIESETPPAQGVPDETVAAVRKAQERQRATGLRDALLLFAGALGGVVLVAGAAGWVIAGRALAPVREFSATARTISAEHLHRRLDHDGLREELRELADTFNDMLDRLEHAFETQDRFVASASHELRTPLALVHTEADIALEDPNAGVEELRDALAHVCLSARRGADVVEALLVLARARAAPERSDDVDLDAIVRAAAEAAPERAQRAAVTVECDLPGPPLRVAGDPALLRSLVGNLVDNGVAYNTPGGTVVVTGDTDEAARTVRVRVQNTGHPIAEDEIEDLFAPFARGDTSRSRRTGGAGIGLAIVRAVTEAHRGTVHAVPGTAGGLDITITLPAAPAPEAPTLEQ